jgi:hypothetical protein
MAVVGSLQDRQFNSFTEDSNGDVAVRVSGETLSQIATALDAVTEDNGTNDFILVGGKDGGNNNFKPLTVDAQGNLQVDVLTIPAITANPTDYKVAIDEVSAAVTYIGKAAAGSATSSAVWQIAKLGTSGTVTLKTTADGDFLFNNVWDNRASLTYS